MPCRSPSCFSGENVEWESFGRGLVFIGLTIAALGALFLIAGKWPGGTGETFGWLGRLPGDIFIKRGNFSFYCPLTTSILISVVLCLLVYLVSLFKH
jgi:hypothetical protein